MTTGVTRTLVTVASVTAKGVAAAIAESLGVRDRLRITEAN